ncbi:MAG: hypothetical protein FWD52_04725 [Candidatus Bathyarchaeota archaeon]|nr:hypothetical protein [Candidatus Termiticorpusculum sp.]
MNQHPNTPQPPQPQQQKQRRLSICEAVLILQKYVQAEPDFEALEKILIDLNLAKSEVDLKIHMVTHEIFTRINNLPPLQPVETPST